MTDVIKIARNHRDRLKTEIDKIDEFIAMAEELARRGEGDSPKKQAEAKSEEPTIELARRNGAAAN